jgi:hypothetical protein
MQENRNPGGRNFPNRNFRAGNANNASAPRARGAAAWEPTSEEQVPAPEVSNAAEEVAEEFFSEVEAHAECDCGDGGDFEGQALLRAGGFWSEDVRKLMNERRRKNLCLNCGGTGHYRSDCKNPEDLQGLDKKVEGRQAEVSPEASKSQKPKLRAVFSVEDGQPVTDWTVDIVDDESGKV